MLDRYDDHFDDVEADEEVENNDVEFVAEDDRCGAEETPLPRGARVVAWPLPV